MGQISLPKLNRINGSMFWESSLIFEEQKSKSLKLYIFYTHFIKYFYLYSYFNYLYSWQRNSFFMANSSIKSFETKKTNENFISNSLNVDNTVFRSLKVYLYSINKKFFVFFIYLNLKNYKNFDAVTLPIHSKNLSLRGALYV